VRDVEIQQEHAASPGGEPETGGPEPLHFPGLVDQFHEGEGDHDAGSEAHEQAKGATTGIAVNSEQPPEPGAQPGYQAEEDYITEKSKISHGQGSFPGFILFFIIEWLILPQGMTAI